MAGDELYLIAEVHAVGGAGDGEAAVVVGGAPVRCLSGGAGPYVGQGWSGRRARR